MIEPFPSPLDIPPIPESNLTIRTDKPKVDLVQWWIDSDAAILSTDGSVKKKGNKSYELTGVVTFSKNATKCISTRIIGEGESSYNAETAALLEALEKSRTLGESKIIIVTDCLSILGKIKSWQNWNTQKETKIARTLRSLTSSGKQVTLHWARSHADTSVNCVVDELINATWEKKTM